MRPPSLFISDTRSSKEMSTITPSIIGLIDWSKKKSIDVHDRSNSNSRTVKIQPTTITSTTKAKTTSALAATTTAATESEAKAEPKTIHCCVKFYNKQCDNLSITKTKTTTRSSQSCAGTSTATCIKFMFALLLLIDCLLQTGPQQQHPRAVLAIKLVRVEVPVQVKTGQLVKLLCIYELQSDKLQSLVWYKNGKEFYRFQPADRRSVQVFNRNGINVDTVRSRHQTLLFNVTSPEASGKYRCEVTSNSFETESLHGHMQVVSNWAPPTTIVSLSLLVPITLFATVLCAFFTSPITAS